MNPYEEAQQQHTAFRDDGAQRVIKAFLRLQMVAAEKLPLRKRHESQELSAQNATKSSRIAEFVRGCPPLPRPVKAGIGLVALLATLAGGLLWHRRRK